MLFTADPTFGNSVPAMNDLQVMLVAIHPWDCAGAKQVCAHCSLRLTSNELMMY